MSRPCAISTHASQTPHGSGVGPFTQFNALLKSIEEPPAHVVFMMATTELEKIPDTILSRSQVYEFRTISGKAITDQLRRIVDADGTAHSIGPVIEQIESNPVLLERLMQQLLSLRSRSRWVLSGCSPYRVNTQSAQS